MRKILLILICLGLTACAEAKIKQINQMLDAYIGRPVSELALRFGPPTTEFESGPGQRAFQWEHYGQTPGVIAPIGGSLIVAGPQRRECRLSVVASTNKPNPTLGDWIVQRYQWAGNGCI